MIIAVEGINGSGKSTISRMLFRKYQKEGREVILAGEPGHTTTGDKIRKILLGNNDMCGECRLLMYLASMADMVSSIIGDQPISELRDKVIILDRYIFSTLAYQGNVISSSMIIEIMDAVGILRLWPDITLVIDVDPEVALSRKGKLDTIESSDIEIYDVIRERYLELAQDYIDTHVIDGSRPITEVYTDIVGVIDIYNNSMQGFTPSNTVLPDTLARR